MDDAYKSRHTKNPSDDDTPFSKPDDIEETRSETHPQTDTNIDEDEVYHHGLPDEIKKIDPEEPSEPFLETDTH